MRPKASNLRSQSDSSDGFAERLRAAIGAAGGPASVARDAKIPIRTLQSYLAGDSGPPPGRLVAIADVTHVSIEWLAAGRGPKHLDRTFAELPTLPLGRLGETPAAYGTDDGTEHGRERVVDRRLLQDVVQTIEEALAESGGALAPAKKGQAIALVYDHCLKTGQIDRAYVADIIRLAT